MSNITLHNFIHFLRDNKKSEGKTYVGVFEGSYHGIPIKNIVFKGNIYNAILEFDNYVKNKRPYLNFIKETFDDIYEDIKYEIDLCPECNGNGCISCFKDDTSVYKEIVDSMKDSDTVWFDEEN